MAKPQESFPRTVELSMDDCKVVVDALRCYKATKIRAAKANAQDPAISELFMKSASYCDFLASKF